MRKVVSYLLIAVLVLGTGLVDWQKVSAASAGEVKQEINDLEEKQDQLNKKKSEIKNDKANTEEKIDENLDKQEDVKGDINSIDQQLDTTRNKIEAKENDIAATNKEIEELKRRVNDLHNRIDQLKEEIKELKERIKKREKLLKDRLRAIQSNGGSMKYLEVILGAQSFGDFISRSSAVNTIMDQDKHIMETHMAEKKEVESKKEEVEQKKAEVEEKKAEVEAKKASLESQRQELESLKSQLNDQMAEKEQKMGELKEQHNHLEQYKMSLAEQQQVLNDQAAVIAQAKKEAQNQLNQLSGDNKGSSSSSAGGGNGTFIWPVSPNISSGFGSRSLGYHYGVDFAHPTGTAVSAAAGGVVTRSAYSSSYGNVIYIYHAQYDKTTVYAHLSSRSVSLGQSVSRGQTIGAVGNTGNSYGAHLHFEVHNGGWNYHSGINPMPFLP
ncbi:murein hydrolase activator EnvC family protein [Virgibacillus doumboii]|uniref:murein hydrolase activator EnvC family protein n=1 Tax=Virgibacillus doumboii TaxID=2697503 RepID=UPI0013DE7FD9|nr:M23 family metallopeptidase [Virgibacillus doumboii]